MNNIEELTKRIIDLRDARDWKQFHNPKDVALSPKPAKIPGRKSQRQR